MYELLRYQTRDRREPFSEWLNGLRDRQARARILTRLDRLERGNLGDCRACRAGVSELRLDFGPGYRVYFGMAGKQLVVLLAGGDKDSQPADIARAVGYWEDFKHRQRRTS